jgi:ParB family chromosome partitioning protein
LHQETPHRAGAGECDHVDIHMQGERLAGRRTRAWNDIEHASRHAGFQCQLSELERGQRRLLGWLEHDRVAHGERRRDLPHRHEQREIPRHDGADHAKRLVHGKGKAVARLGADLAINLVESLGVVAQRAD